MEIVNYRMNNTSLLLFDLIRCRSAYEEFIPSSSRNYVMFDKLKRFCKKLKNRERRWYLCAYVDYVMNWELYGIVCFPVEVFVLFFAHVGYWENRYAGRKYPCHWYARSLPSSARNESMNSC